MSNKLGKHVFQKRNLEYTQNIIRDTQGMELERLALNGHGMEQNRHEKISEKLNVPCIFEGY